MKKSGLTLIELTFVLFILTLAAHLGTRQLATARAARLRAAADRQLDEIADAVYCEGQGEASGFLSDMGRLPLATYAPGGASPSLAELYVRPEGVGDFMARPAKLANLAEGAPDAIADESVLVPCGWGGPYIRLPQGATLLRDPWGNPMENGGADVAARLLAADMSSPATTNTPIAAIRHFGSDGTPDGERPPASGDAMDSTRKFAFGSAWLLLDFEPGVVARVMWYAPLGDKITGGVAYPEPATPSQLRIEGIPPGRRIVCIHFTDGTSRVMSVQLRAGSGAVLPITH